MPLPREEFGGRSRVWLLVAGMALALSLAGCLGGGDSTSGNGNGTQSSSATEPDANSPSASSTACPVRHRRAPIRAAAPAPPLPAMPLHAEGRWIVDAKGKRVKLASVSWYGAESTDFVPGGLQCHSAAAIAGEIRALGFNSVRLPWSDALVEQDPPVAESLIAADPGLAGVSQPRGLEVFRHVVDALAREHLMVILDNHLSDAGWCCGGQHDTADLDGLWWNNSFPETCWVEDWRKMAQMFEGEPAVVGADLRNEPRDVERGPEPRLRTAACGDKHPPPQDGGATPVAWGGGAPEERDWRAAAARGGEAVTEANPKLLVMVEGIGYGRDLRAAYHEPVELPRDRVVYSPHEYSDTEGDCTKEGDCSNVHENLGKLWGFLIVQHSEGDLPPTAPLWVGEFGTCNAGLSCVSSRAGTNGTWFPQFAQYLRQGDIDWSYWPLNGTQSSGARRKLGDPETYGVLDPTWSRPSSGPLLCALRSVQAASQGPGVTPPPAPAQEPAAPGDRPDPTEALARLRDKWLTEPTDTSPVVDADGDCPLAATASGSTSADTTATVWLFTTGAWEPAATFSLPIPVAPRTPIVAGDLTGQGTHDFLVQMAPADAELGVIFSDASGRWDEVAFRENGRDETLVRSLTWSHHRLFSIENDCKPSCATGTQRRVEWRYDAGAGKFVPRPG